MRWTTLNYELLMVDQHLSTSAFQSHAILRTHKDSNTFVKYQSGQLIAKSDYGRTFQCPFDGCEKYRYKKLDLLEHIRGMHEKTKTHQCKFCEYTSAFRKHIKLHTQTVHSQTPREKEQCDKCELTFLTQTGMRHHHRIKHNPKFDPEKYPCNQCDTKFGFKNRLQKHIENVHEKLHERVCETCGASLKNRESYENHIKVVHNKIKNFPCDQCDYKGNTRYVLTHHIKSVHDKNFDQQCEECPYATTEKSKLDLHVKNVHLKIRPYSCEECKYGAIR